MTCLTGTKDSLILFAYSHICIEHAVAWANEKGVVTGKAGNNFAPNDNATREQLVAMIYRLSGSPAVKADNLSRFKDKAEVSDYAKDAMNWAIENGIIDGTGNGMLSPKSMATRSQIAAITERLMKLNKAL